MQDSSAPHPVVPVFIFAVPRSGSTLVQRMLAAHRSVSSTSEPWLLLPVVGAAYPDLVVGGPWHGLVATGVEDFSRRLPRGREELCDVVAKAVLELYARAASPGTRCFVDKSTGYSLVADGIMRLLPQARFVFVWRNPLAVAASLSSTWQAGRWRPDDYSTDLRVGLPRLIETFRRHGTRAHAIRFEDLLVNPEATWSGLTDYLELQPDPAAHERFAEVRLGGRLGDPTGVAEYRTLDQRPLTEWRSQVGTPPRRWWCRRYLHWLGSERLAMMGYSLDALLAELDEAPRTFHGVARDACDVADSRMRARLRAARWRRSHQRLMRWIPDGESAPRR